MSKTPLHRVPSVAWLLVILAVYSVVYAPVRGFDLVWDDLGALRDNPLFAGGYWDGIFASQHDHLDPQFSDLRGATPAHDSYRPLLYLSFRTDVALFGMSAAALHLHNLLWGALAIVAMFAASRALLRDTAGATVATALFALHPMQVETVAYVSTRGDLMAGTMALTASWLVLKESGRSRVATRAVANVGAIALFLASLLCKESSVALPLCLMFILLAQGRARERIAGPIGMLLVLPPYLLFRAQMAQVTGSEPLSVSALHIPGVFTHYLGLFFIPSELSIDRPYSTKLIAVGWVLLSAFALAAVQLLRRGADNSSAARRRELILIALAGLGWCALLLAPASIVVRIHNTLSDRYAYVPFAGIGWSCGALVVLAHRALAHQSALLASLTAAWIATLSIVSARQVYAWENPLSLYSHAVLTTPLVANSHFRLGTYALKTGDCATAVTILSKAIELDSSHVKARANYGACLLRLGRFDEARTSLETLVNDFPRHRTGWYNLGVAYRQLGRTADACGAFGRALELDHRYRKAELALRQGCGQDFRNKGSAP